MAPHPRQTGSIARRPGVWPSRLAFAVTVLAGMFLAGCSLPDLQPFADATASLSSGVDASGEAVTIALQENGFETEAAEFSREFEARRRAMAAFVEYSDALAAIAAAGQKGAESARRVADAFNGLMSQVGAFGVGVPAISAQVTDVIAEGYALVATVRAAKSMKEAVETADPIVQELARVIGADLADMKEIMTKTGAIMVRRIKSCDPPFNPPDCNTTDVLTQQIADFSKQADILEKELAAAARTGPNLDPNKVEQVRNLRGQSDALSARLDARNTLIREARRQTRVRVELLSRTEDGFKAWAAIHKTLAADLRERTQPNLRNLVNAANSLVPLIEKVQEL